MIPMPQDSRTIPSQAEEMRQALARRIAAQLPTSGEQITAIPGLSLYRRTAPSACNPSTYGPSLGLFVQGRKRVNLGGTAYLCEPATFLLTSVDVPVVSQIIEASEAVPLLSLLLRLEIPMVREILGREEFPAAAGPAQGRGIAMGQASPELLGACCRLLDLLEVPADIAFLGDLLQREIVYRLLRCPQGERLRAIATAGEQSNRIAKAVAWLRTNYAKPLRVEELASVAQMGVSTLHHHFRSLTAMSPPQYQKHLRLYAARERMLTEGLDAATAAYEVGYESTSQFSREYRRHFGQSPMRDVRARQLAGPPETLAD